MPERKRNKREQPTGLYSHVFTAVQRSRAQKPVHASSRVYQTYPVGIVVQNHQVSVTDVESREVVTGVFGIEDVLVDHVGGSSGLRRVPAASTHQIGVKSYVPGAS